VRILVDADACPVRGEVESVARRHGVTVLYFANSSQDEGSLGAVRRVNDRRDAADFAIAAECGPGDIVVTDDIGLASMALGEKARALSSRGRQFTPEIIPMLLQERHLARKVRRAGGRTPGPHALTAADRRRFTRVLAEMLGDSTQRP
jgi:uncharacterized protein YaiI (UPF0178 family)